MIQLFTEKVKQSNFDSAMDFLTLLWDEDHATEWVDELRVAGVGRKRVNDVVRAAGGLPWTWEDQGVKRALTKVLNGQKLHPPLLLSVPAGLVIADGSHRVSLAYLLDTSMMIPVVLA